MRTDQRKEALNLFLQSLDAKSYYDILRVSRDSDAAAIKAAFHDFSLLYHPDQYVGSASEVGAVATAIFKRGVEAYRCLSRPTSRSRYDGRLARGRLRFDPARPSTVPPPRVVRTLETLARTPDGKRFGLKADRLLDAGNLDGARVQLVSACQCEPYNEELAERLQLIYEALALEPP
jgi:curved DNA-binding protein CbpA